MSLTSAPPIPRLVFETFKADQAAIDQEFGAPLKWHENEPDKNYKIRVDPIAGDPLDESDWPRQHKWLVDQIAKLHRVFEPRVGKLPTRDELLNPGVAAEPVEHSPA